MEAILSLNTSTNYFNHVASAKTADQLNLNFRYPKCLDFSAPLILVKYNNMSGGEWILHDIRPADIGNKKKFAWMVVYLDGGIG